MLMMGYVLAVAGMHEDKHVTFLPAYGAEMRGGTANCTVVISDQEIASPIASFPECVVAMNFPSMVKYQNSVKDGGIMFLNEDLIKEEPPRRDFKVVKVPANTLAHEMGNDRALNMIMLGAVVAVTGMVSPKSLEEAVATVLQGKKQTLVDANRKALLKGAEFISSSKKAR